MAPFRFNDRWLALGFLVVIYVGGRIISWQIREGEVLTRLAKERNEKRRLKTEQEEEAKRRTREKTEDDISLDHLNSLLNNPDWEISHSAEEIILHRFADSEECMRFYSKAINDKDADPGEKETWQALRQYAKMNYDIGLPYPKGGIPHFLLPRDNSPISFLQSSASSPDVETAPQSPPMLDPEEVASMNLRANEALATFDEMPMDERQEPDPPEPRSHSGDRRQRREAMVIETPERGLEVIEPGETQMSDHGHVELAQADQTVEQVMRNVRELEGQVQHLRESLRRTDSEYRGP